ncbi:MAG: LacI family DNA-binding transcriptional regulator [Thermomicrobiales bacterium]
MSGRRRRPTQFDVATAAGVSQAVVSYVVNNVETVTLPDETRRRVLQAVADLRYVPNTAARMLRSQRTFTIAVIIPDIANPFYPELVRGVQDVATGNSYDVLAVNTDGSEILERNALDAARRGRVDGVILTPFWTRIDELESILGDGIPITLLGEMNISAVSAELPLDSCSISGEDAAATVVGYLIERGHRLIGMIAGLESTPPREGRIRGYRRALTEHHVPLDEFLIRGGDFTEAGGFESMKELLALKPRPTAVFAANDLMALGAFLACRELGLRIPEDVAIAGFDNIPAARLVNPALTTIDQRASALGHRAASLLISRLNGDYQGPPRSELHDFDLIPRESA